jgi:hypothetical protein
MDATVIAALISALAALVAAIMSKLTSRLRLKHLVVIATEDKSAPDQEDDIRLDEARASLYRQESIAKWSCRAAASLIFSQYVVGGILASSFVQDSLSNEITGFLGILVLASSLVHHHYRPDIYSREARQRAARLRTLIRTAEDLLYAIRHGKQGAPSLYTIRKTVSEGLAEIEADELKDIEPDNAELKGVGNR